ncbi:LysR family transcriptional regulator [Pelomonas sp. KK5]|uniref:LysR family transcriptional regulator n=1 Tax=Pelomonas sp. KK5 TaxID=1855730 RepID=UPI00097C0AC9|nr:LysR family transcriptional regulator [Pelomonas sp. KK5]
MEIKQLQTFSRVAEVGNLTRAAGLLGLTQAALSRQMTQLEAELGVELFRRNGRGLVLTDAGLRLREHVPLVMRQLALAERAVRGESGPVRGTIALGLPPSLARTVVIPLIDAFKRQLPDVSLRTVDGLSANLFELVGMGKLDCAVVYGQANSDAAQLRPLAEEELYLVSGPAGTKSRVPPKSIALADLAALPLVTAGNSNAVHSVLAAALAQSGHKPQVAHQIENLNAILDLVRQGYGYSVIPLSGVRPCVGDPELRLHRINKPTLTCSLSMAIPTGSVGDALVEQSASLVLDVVAKQIRQYQREVDDYIG